MTRKIKYSNLDFLNVVSELNGSHTTKIAEKVGCDRRTALLRLKFMASKNMVIGEKRGPVWFWYYMKIEVPVEIENKIPNNSVAELIDPFVV